jgi:hypothetical protein
VSRGSGLGRPLRAGAGRRRHAPTQPSPDSAGLPSDTSQGPCPGCGPRGLPWWSPRLAPRYGPGPRAAARSGPSTRLALRRGLRLPAPARRRRRALPGRLAPGGAGPARAGAAAGQGAQGGSGAHLRAERGADQVGVAQGSRCRCSGSCTGCKPAGWRCLGAFSATAAESPPPPPCMRSKAAGFRFGPHLGTAVPLMIKFAGQGDEGDDELREQCLQVRAAGRGGGRGAGGGAGLVPPCCTAARPDQLQPGLHAAWPACCWRGLAAGRRLRSGEASGRPPGAAGARVVRGALARRLQAAAATGERSSSSSWAAPAGLARQGAPARAVSAASAPPARGAVRDAGAAPGGSEQSWLWAARSGQVRSGHAGGEPWPLAGAGLR